MPADKPSLILIVEDDLDLAEMLNAYFRVQGYEVLTAAWGQDAIQTALASVPDLILLDVRLPDIDGYQVYRQLGEHRRTKDIPVVFLTEKRERSDKLAGLELGAIDYITKPFDIQELRLRVRNTLRRSQYAALANPITGLAASTLIDQRSSDLIQSRNWAVAVVSLMGLAEFRERYGFVAADDVLRAVSLMVANAVQETGAADDLIGHLDVADFVILSTPEHIKSILIRALDRIKPSVQFFFPVQDRESVSGERAPGDMLQLSTGIIFGQGSTIEDVSQLKTALLRSRTLA